MQKKERTERAASIGLGPPPSLGGAVHRHQPDKGELKTIDGKILTTVLIPLTPSFFSEKLKNIKCSAEVVAY